MQSKSLTKATLILVGLLLAQGVRSQTPFWSGILDPSRAVDWTQAGFQIIEPASQCSNQTGSYSPSGGDDAANINALVAGCTSGGYISLAPGTFLFSSTGLIFNASKSVVLRGAGPDQTKLVMSKYFGCFQNTYVCIYGTTHAFAQYSSPYGTGSGTTWTGDNGAANSYAKGDTVINIGSASGIAVGQMIFLDQDSDSYGFPTSGTGCSESGSTVTCNTTVAHNFSIGDTVWVGGSSYPTNNNCGQGTAAGYAGQWTVTATPTSTSFQYTNTATGFAACTGGYASKDTGGVFISNVQGQAIDQNNNYIGRQCPSSSGNYNPACASGETSFRNQVETHIVTAINGNRVTITPPVLMNNWRASQNPGVFWTGTYPGSYAIGDGIEGLTIDSSQQAEANGGTVVFFNAYKCWIKNTRVISGDYYHVLIMASSNIDVEDNYLVGTRNGQNGTYGVDAADGGGNNLVQNNIFQHIPASLIVEGGYGNVFSYNYAVDDAYASLSWLPEAMAINHGVSGMNLFESNNTPSCRWDDIHGSGDADTLFRSRCRGQDTPAKTEDTYAIQLGPFQRGENVIGNILGTSGTQTVYQQGSGISQLNGYLYAVGLPGATGDSVPNDPIAGATLLRWGNYDVVTGAVRWCGNSLDTGWSTTCSSTSEITTTGVPYIHGNAMPSAGDTGIGQPDLPPSFYLGAQPGFWTMKATAGPTPPWPAIGPDVTTGTAPDTAGGHSYAIPAQLCYQNTPLDTNYQQSYTVTAATWSSGTATLTIGANSLAVYDTINVAGLTGILGVYDGTFQVTAVSSSTVSFALPESSNPGSYTQSGGTSATVTATSPNILVFNAANCYVYLTPQTSLIAPPQNLVTHVH